MDERLSIQECKCQSLERDNEELKSKADDLENRSRRNNLRILGIPENVETARPSHFMVSFFTELFREKLSQTPEIECAPVPRTETTFRRTSKTHDCMPSPLLNERGNSTFLTGAWKVALLEI